jgi:predicted transposase YbfD/YdcC
VSVPEKSNEITAIPDLLDQLAEAKQLEGALVSIDAMGCQVEIADKVVVHGADYLLAKGNQPTLETDVEHYFRTASVRDADPSRKARRNARTPGKQATPLSCR